MRLNLSLFLVLWALLGVPSRAAWTAPIAATHGFYPLWENTGHVERGGRLYLGTDAAQIGIAGVAHVGTAPLGFLYRTPNGYVKVRLMESRQSHVALTVAVNHLLREASRASLSPMYPSRLDNADTSLTLFTPALSWTFVPTPWLALHSTATLLASWSPGALRDAVYGGASLAAELRASGPHSLSFHAAEIGLWRHDLWVAGVSYRFAGSWLEARLGYFYRFHREGAQSGPLASVGVRL